jgi:hypothetical protein
LAPGDRNAIRRPRDDGDLAAARRGGSTSARLRTALALIVTLGLGLRVWNARTAVFHPDEPDLLEDAYWSVAPISMRTAVDFLRLHPRDHLRLNPTTGSLVLRPPSNPGHLGLYPFVMGCLIYVVRPRDMQTAVLLGRSVNILADATVIALVPRVVAGFGGGAGAGLLAAGLLATYPPAVVYGSTANIDPLLTLLFSLLVVCLLDASRRWTWVRAGLLTGLCVGAKQTGLVTLAWVPLVWWMTGPRDGRSLLVWGVLTVGVAVVLADPVAYLTALRHPTDPFVQLTFDPLAHIRDNVARLAQPSAYYSLSFSRHGEPLAPLLARVHRIVTPMYLVAFAVGLVAACVRRASKAVLFGVLPVVLVLAFVQPSDGMWRFHVLCPLVAALAALALPRLPFAWRGLVAVAALVAGILPLLPQRPGNYGVIDLGELLFMNPQARQMPGFYAWWKMRPLVVRLAPGVELHRTLWVSPGATDVVVFSDGEPSVRLDGDVVLDPGRRRGRVDLKGHLHRLTVGIPAGGILRGLVVRPAGR